MEGGEVRETLLGSPQGGVISPLLANIYLDVLDRLWERAVCGNATADTWDAWCAMPTMLSCCAAREPTQKNLCAGSRPSWAG